MTSHLHGSCSRSHSVNWNLSLVSLSLLFLVLCFWEEKRDACFTVGLSMFIYGLSDLGPDSRNLTTG